MAKGHKMNRSVIPSKKKGEEKQAWEGHNTSTQEMVVKKLGNKSFYHPETDVYMNVVCEDENGTYVTNMSFVRGSLFDPYRFDNYARMTNEKVKKMSDIDLENVKDEQDEKTD